MFKWHVHSAIGRSRPVAADISRVADGIAASLRQFSVSLSRSNDDGPIRRRSQSAGDTFNEVSSLGPKPRVGIDARSLAAKAPQKQPGGFTITRFEVDSFPRPNSPNYRGRGGSGGGGGEARGDFRGGARGGVRGAARGGARGRGGDRGRGLRGRGRGRMDPKDRKKQSGDEEYEVQPLSEAEIAYLDLAESGFMQPYEPTTDLASLMGYGAPTISSPRGIQENLIHRFATAAGTERNPGGFRAGREHLFNVSRNGMSMFENVEQRRIAEAWQKRSPDEAAEYIQNMGVQPIHRREIGTLSEEQKKDVLGAWVAGQHTAPRVEKKGDVLSTVGMMTRRNETYLPEDAKRFEDKLRSLLPRQSVPSAAAQRAAQKPRAIL